VAAAGGLGSLAAVVVVVVTFWARCDLEVARLWFARWLVHAAQQLYMVVVYGGGGGMCHGLVCRIMLGCCCLPHVRPSSMLRSIDWQCLANVSESVRELGLPSCQLRKMYM
jgi:hypothetical protein